MKRIFLLAAFSGAVLAAGAQKTVYDQHAEARPVTAFHAVQVSHAFDVVITQGTEEALAVSASNKEDIQYIRTSVENGVLKIWQAEDKKWWPKNRKLKAYISVKNLDAIRASGASDIKIEGGLKADNLQLHLSGASDLTGQLNVSQKLEVDLSGASDVTISGSADNISIDASGASELKAYDFKADTCSVEASGASGVQITVDKELSARLSGASSVNYKGSALIREIKTSGASNIRKS
jgi:hypothetical protein